LTTSILIVEDELLVAKDIRRFLQGLDYEVVGMAVAGDEAVRKSLELRPDLILMDIRLKGEMDGITAVEQIREQFDVPVVYLTAQWDKKTRERARATGAYGYVLKPWVERELEIGIEMALAIHTKERQVAESEERVRRIVQNALDAVVMMDAEGTILDWNPQAETTFGCPRNEALGQKVADLIIPPQLREAHTRGLANFQATGRGRILNQRIEFTAVRIDGGEFPVELAVTPVRSGESYVFSAFIRDITDRKLSRERIEASERKYRTLVETTNTGFLITDEQGRVIDANSEYVRLCGHMTLSDVCGRSVLEWTVQYHRERHAKEIRMCLESEASRSFEIRYGKATGRFTPIEVNATRLQTEDGWRILSLCRDITDRQRHEQELEEYAGAVSHDLKKPLGMVMRHIQRLEKRLHDHLGDADLEHIRTAVQGTKHMERLIEELKNNEEFGRRAVEPVDCNHVLARVLEVLGPDIDAASAVLKADSLPMVIANEWELMIVFQNIIGNAIKYCADRRLQIYITAQRQGNDWQFSVRDNGIGIQAKDTSEVFQIWKRLFQKQDVEGRGIGLANCKKAIERRGGRIWVESQPGEGSTFLFTLPADDKPLTANDKRS
jgi:PAS domain S-box-containing protein